MNFIGENYHSFIKENTKKYEYIDNQDGFNMSFIEISNDEYLFCIRCLGTIPAYFGEEIIPGNYSLNKDYIKKKIKDKELLSLIDFGKNFFWGSWTSTLLDNTIFFVGKLEKQDKKIFFKPNRNIKPYVISNFPIFIKNKKSKDFFYSDVRLIKYDNKILCYDGFVSGIYEIVIKNNKIFTAFKFTNKITYLFYLKTNICENVKEYDKNWSFVKKNVINGDNYFLFLNWFENDCLSITNVPFSRDKNDCIKENIIKMKKDKLLGLGSDKCGMFSLGVPLAEYKCDDEYCGIGIGHIKICTNKKYTNKNIIDFLDNIKLLKEKSNKLITHLSYHYLSYFFILKKNGNKYSFLISDGYLFTDSKKEYTFTINFPMSIIIKNEKILVSMGVGDYYNTITSFKLPEIIQICKHNLEEFNLDEYKYKIIDRNNIVN